MQGFKISAYLDNITHHKGDKYICPVCGGNNLSIPPNADTEGYKCFNGCETKAIRETIAPWADRQQLKPESQPKPARPKQTRQWVYTDSYGNPCIRVNRTDDGSGRKKIWQEFRHEETWKTKAPDEAKARLKAAVTVYRYPEVMAAIDQGQQIFWVEGEPCADLLWSMGLPATTSIGGSVAYKSYGDYSQVLKGADLVICPDLDATGIKYANAIATDYPAAQWLYAFSDSPTWDKLPQSGGLDVADWVANYQITADQILAAIEPEQRRSALTAITAAPAVPPEPKPEKRSIPDQLIDIGRSEAISYFKTADGLVYADLKLDGKRQTVALRSKDLKQYLRAELFDKTGKSPGAEAVQQAIDTLEALALRKCPQQEVKVRLADHDGKIYLDLADDSWQAIEIDADGWRVTNDYPVRFKRGGTAPMLKPAKNGSLAALRELCQFDFDTWVLIVCFLVQCLKPSGEYPVLCLHGPSGAGKSTITKMLKRLIDPSPVLTRSNVGDVRQFAIHATKRHVIAIDNLSGLNAEQSDILCRAATGGGHTERTLHSDHDETNFSFVNPLILNGIDSIATRGDLLSRAFLVTLHAPDKRLQESVFEERFAEIQPGVFGGLLDLLSKVLALLPSIEGTYEGTERFVGFVELGLAIEQVLGWESGTVLRVLAGVREEAHETAIESSPVGQAIQELMLGRECWTGTASELLQNLSRLVPDKTAKGKYWPSDGTRLSKSLTRLEPDLKALGLEISREKRTGGLRMVTIERIDRTTAMPPASIEGEGELRPGVKVVVTDGEYSREGLSVGDWVIVNEVRLSAPTPQIPKPTPFAVVSDPKGNKHSVWVAHLKPWQENDRLGLWGVAS
jgi:energy-coupling factor transporter ATP-binding protein EcfA2